MEKEKKPKSTRGGARPGSGRKAGSRNKKTQELLDNVAATGLTPLEYMLQVLRNTENSREARMDAAKAAAPYLHPKLANIEMTGGGGGPLVVEIVRHGPNPAAE